MKFVADLHIHSKYSRATSKNMDLENLDKWAKIKGIRVVGTGDFTHPEWFKHLKDNLEPAEPGLFKLKKSESPTRFLLTSEISCIYSKGGKVRKIHILVFAPTFEIVEKINVQLGWIGNIKSDGRPILGLDAKELAKIILSASSDCLVVPAHCLLPDTYIHTEKGIKKIKDIERGNRVYTHKGRLKKVTEIFQRAHKGYIYTIQPYYFRLGLTTTPEHPYYIIQNDRYKGRSNYYGEQLKRDYFHTKKPEWVEASRVKVGDILLFPRFKETSDRQILQLDKHLNPITVEHKENKIAPLGFKRKWIADFIKVDQNFCRLIGYYLAEGYTNSRDAIIFCFNEDEHDYIEDLKFLMEKTFGLQPSRIKQKDNKGIEFIYYSKILSNLFGHLFYISPTIKRAHTKALPEWMLRLPEEKQVEIFRGWWRGDCGITTSRVLMNQMKIILLRLGIIPSIRLDSKKKYRLRGKHFIDDREIFAKNDLFSFSSLSFFEDKFNLLKEKEFVKYNYKTIRRNGWINKNYIYLPIKNIKKTIYQGEVYNLEVKEDNSYLSEFATVHNCWTPWFSIFGSKSGFDSIEECFEEYSKYIYAGETGLSSDPAMNWRLSALDKIALISNSDAHSPQKIGREANVFDTDLSYAGIVEAIKSKDPQKFLYTVEFYPEEGKYHLDGHRNCEVRLTPKETKKYNGICPACGKPLTIGVLNRVEELADREEGFRPERAIPFKNLVPLEEIIADAVGQNTGTKEVLRQYDNLIEKAGTEFNILLDISQKELEAITLPEIAHGIIRVREGKVFKEGGYDGVYGKIKVFSQEKEKQLISQKTLF